MRFQYFNQLLAVSTAMFFGGVVGADGYDYHQEHAKPSSSDITTTITTTQYTTKTSTSITTVTKTRQTPCPTAETGIINFDDLETSGVSPMPLIYQDFSFSGSAGWQYFNRSAFAPTSPEYRSVHSPTNALLSRSYGLVSFGSQERGFSFDLTSAAFFGFTESGTPDSLIIQIKLARADGSTETIFADGENAGVHDRESEVIDPAELGDFTDLVNIEVAVWQSYDNSTGEGNPAQFVLDDLKYIKRKCSGNGGY